MASDLLPSAPLLTEEETSSFYERHEGLSSTYPSERNEVDRSIAMDNIHHNVLDSEIKIQPFSENQLMGLLLQGKHLQQYQDIDHFIDQFLIEMQIKESDDCSSNNSNQIMAEQNSLRPLVISYMTARKGLSKARSSIDIRLGEAKDLEDQLWTFVSKVSQMKGRCHDDKELSSSHEYNWAEFNESASTSLRQAHKDVKNLITEDHALHNFKATSARVSIEQRLKPILYDNGGGNTDKDILKRTVSVLFGFQRTARHKNLNYDTNGETNDPIFVEDSRHWLEQSVLSLLQHPECNFDDQLFILHHILRCSPGFGRWAARLFQPQPPTLEIENSRNFLCLLDNSKQNQEGGMEALHHILIMISTLMTPVRDRDNHIRETFPNIRPSKKSPAGSSSSSHTGSAQSTPRRRNPYSNKDTVPGNDPWVLVDSDGEDEEGMEHNLRENDLVSLLNQVPFEAAFRHILRIEIRDGVDKLCCDPTIFSETTFLKLFAFGTRLVFIMREGLSRFSKPGYRQFAKKVGNIISQTVQYISDQWELLRDLPGNAKYDPSMRHRLQVEFDEFHMRAVKALFSTSKTRGSGVWQYLSRLPYKCISTKMLWRILYVLCFDPGYDTRDSDNRELDDLIKLMKSSETKGHFREFLVEVADTDRQFLLWSLVSMATSRNVYEDSDFIEHISKELIEIGFIDPTTTEICFRETRDLLIEITRVHSSLLSFAVEQFNAIAHDSPEVKRLMYLAKALPFELWYPSQEEFDIIQRWLLDCPIGSSHSHMARVIINSMDWSVLNNEYAEEGNENKSIDRSIHNSLAVCITEAYLKFASPKTTVSGIKSATNKDKSALDVSQVAEGGGYHLLLSEGFRNLASVTRAIRKTPEQRFASWAWETLSRLHLHHFDQSIQHFNKLSKTFDKYSAMDEAKLWSNRRRDVICEDLDLSGSMERVAFAVTMKIPLACYTALQLSQTGHLIEDIRERGFDQLYILAVSGHYDHVMECLICLTPFFAEEPNDKEVPVGDTEMLTSSTSFMKAIENIVNADQTYFKMAKDLIITDFPGPVLKEFGNMLAKQIHSHKWFGLTTEASIILMWLKVLIKIPNWNNNKTTLYIVDVLCNHAILMQKKDSETHALQLVKHTFGSHLREIEAQEKTSNQRGFLSWMSGSNKNGNHNTIISPSCAVEFPSFAFFALEAEEETVSNTDMWNKVLDVIGDHEILDNGANNDIDKMIAIAAKQLDLPVQLTTSFPIYKWSHLILDAPIDHPMQVAFGQKFFQYYFAKSRPSKPNEEGQVVGSKFFTGIMNNLHISKVKLKFKSISEFYADPLCSRSTKESPAEENANQQLVKATNFDQMMKLFTAYHMWLNDDNNILSTNLHIPSLAPCFMPDRLAEIMSGETSLWIELISISDFRYKASKAAKDWEKLHFRVGMNAESADQISKKRINVKDGLDLDSPKNRIIKRLKSHDSPLPLPPRRYLTGHQSSSMPSTPTSSSNNCEAILLEEEKLKMYLENALTTLSKYVKTFNIDSLEFNGTLCAFMEEAPSLYTNSQVEVIVNESCVGSTGPKGEKFGCAGSALIVHKFKRARKQEVVEHKMETSRRAIQAVTERLTDAIPYKLAQMVTLIQDLANVAVTGYKRLLQEDNETESYRQAALFIFYALCDGLSDEMVDCPPIRNLMSCLLEYLGQEVVMQQIDQCLPLLKRLVKKPDLSQFVSQYFSPSVENDQFSAMYKKIGEIPHSEATLAFVLLSKMNVDDWIRRSPPPSPMDKSRLISQLGTVLRKTGDIVRSTQDGSRAAVDLMMLHGIYRKHLSLLSVSNFPEHFGEVVGLLLILSESQTLDPNIWYDVMNAMLTSITTPGQSVSKSRMQLSASTTINICEETASEFAVNQRIAQLEDVLQLWKLMSSHFEQERSGVGLHGLYTKYKDYSDPLAMFFLILGRLIIILQIKEDKGTHADTLVEKIWKCLCFQFEPWICPQSHDRIGTAIWIKQLAESQNTLLLPWAPGDTLKAKTMCDVFVRCVSFLHYTVPAPKSAMALLWELYVQKLAKTSVKDYVLSVIHERMLAAECRLSWSTFYPRREHLHSMVTLVDTFLPMCHEFLGKVFVDIPWKVLVRPNDDSIKVISPLLHIATKLSSEPQVRKDGRMLQLLRGSEVLPWHLVHPSVYENLMLWYVMSIDCLVIFDHPQRHPLDSVILHLLHLASRGRSSTGVDHKLVIESTGLIQNNIYNVDNKETGDLERQGTNAVTIMMSKKFQTFIRCSVKLLISSANKHKCFLEANSSLLQEILIQLISNIEEELSYYEGCDLSHEDQLQVQTKFFAIEILRLLNANGKSVLPSIALKCILSWLNCFSPEAIDGNEHQNGTGGASQRGTNAVSRRLLKAIIENAGTCINKVEDAADILETALEAYFRDSDIGSVRNPSNNYSETSIATKWNSVNDVLKFPSRQEKITLFIDHCLNRGYALLIYSYVTQKRTDATYCLTIKDEEVLLSSLLDWLRHIKLSQHSEPKLCLLYHEILLMCHRQLICGASPSSVCKHAIELVDILLGFIGEGISTVGGTSNVAWNILGAIGITQTPYKPSPRFRFLAVGLAYFLLRQIVIEQKNVNDPNILDQEKSVPLLRTNKQQLPDQSTGEADLGIGADELKLSCPDKIEALEVMLANMKKDQAYLGLIENLDWVLEKSRDSCNNFNDACSFIQFIVGNNLYTEGYCVSLTIS